MITLGDGTIWAVIILLGLGTFAIRFSFLGLIGRHPLPEWALRLLRYTPVAVIPGLIAPAVFLPPEGAAWPDMVRLAAVMVTLGVGVWTRNAIWAILGGAATLTVLTLLTA